MLVHLTLDCFLCSDDVKPQNVSGGTVQVDSIHVDNLDVDSKNNEGYVAIASLVPRSNFFAYVTRRKDGSAKNIFFSRVRLSVCLFLSLRGRG